MLSLTCVLACMLAGCSQGGSGSASDSPGPGEDTSGNLPANDGLETNETPPLPTDILYLAEAPDFTTIPPTAEEPNETGLPFQGALGLTPDQGRLTWTYDVRAAGEVTDLQANIWVRVTEPLAGPPDGTVCTWGLRLTIFNPDGTQLVAFQTVCAEPAGPTVGEGDHELVFATDGGFSGGLSPGSTLRVELSRDAAGPGGDDSVLVLTGAAEFASRIRFEGLQEPLAKG